MITAMNEAVDLQSMDEGTRQLVLGLMGQLQQQSAELRHKQAMNEEKLQHIQRVLEMERRFEDEISRLQQEINKLLGKYASRAHYQRWR